MGKEKGLLTSWYNEDTLRTRAVVVDVVNRETLKIAAMPRAGSADPAGEPLHLPAGRTTVETRIVRAVPEERTFADYANQSINIWLIAFYWVWFFAFFLFLLWFFDGS